MELSRLSADDLPFDLGYLHLTRKIGEGNTGRSFQAESRGMGGLPQSVAVTILAPEILQDEQRWRDLQTEVGRAALLRHRGVVRIFSLAVQSGTPYLISELVEGPSLEKLLSRGGPLAPRQALDVGIQLISALGAAHEPRPGSADLPVPHGELRPSAVMVGLDGVVKLRGFGLGKLHSSRPGRGAISFAAPEALSGQRLSLGTDLFSLGGVLFYVLTGRLPFPVHSGASSGERLAAIVKGLRGGGVLTEVDEVVAGLGKAFSQMVCLDPALRFQSAGAAEAVFREVRGALPRSSRLKEVITERFGDEIGDSSGVDGSDALSQYLAADPSISSSRPRVPSNQDGEGVPGEQSSGPPSLAVESSRDLGAPDPPPIPVPRREIRAAPRSGPTLVDPGQVTIPPKEAFRPPSGPDEPTTEGGYAGAGQGASVALGPTFEPVAELALDTADETTDAGSFLGAGRGSSGQLPAHRAFETAPLPSPLGEAVRGNASEVASRRGPVSRSGGQRKRGPARGLVLLIGLLLFVVLGLAATLQLRSEKTPTPGAAETDSSAAATNDSEAVETASPVPVNEVLGNDSESQGGQPVVDEQASVEVEQGRRQRGSEDTSAAEGSSDRRERRRKNADSGGRSDDSEEESAGSGKPVSLLIAHRPITAARVGSSELVTVNLDAPRSTRVVLHSGPAGGPYKKARLKAKSGGRWEGWIDFKGTSVGSDFHYWVVASHPRASSNATSASRSSPHRVAIQ